MVAFFGPHHEGTSALAKPEQPSAMSVAAAASANFRSADSFIFSSASVGFGLLDGVYGPADRVDADTKTQGQGLDDGLSRIRHANCECELAQLVEEERGDDGRNRKATTAEQRRSAEYDNGDGRKQQRIALERRRFAGDAGDEHAGQAVQKLGVHIGQQLMK